MGHYFVCIFLFNSIWSCRKKSANLFQRYFNINILYKILESSSDKFELRIPVRKFYLGHLKKKTDISGVIGKVTNPRILSYNWTCMHEIWYTYKTSEKKMKLLLENILLDSQKNELLKENWVLWVWCGRPNSVWNFSIETKQVSHESKKML